MLKEGVEIATNVAQSEVVFGVLFIILLVCLLWFGRMLLEKSIKDNALLLEKVDILHEKRRDYLLKLMDETKTENKEREEQLMNQNKLLLSQVDRICDSFEVINGTQIKIQENLNELQKNVFKLETRLNYELKEIKEKVEDMGGC